MGNDYNDTNDSTDENSKYKDGVNRNARLIVRNLSFKATEKELREHFSHYGTVEEVKLLRRPDGKLVGCGFVHFTQVPMANKALSATNKKLFLDRPIQVGWAIPRYKYSEQRQDNEATDDRKSKPEKSEIKCKREIKTEPEKQKPRVNRNARLVIRNVSFKATEESLKEYFAPYGDILEVKLLKKPDGKLVGCAFVHYKNVPMAKKALLNTNMKPFLGRPISVDWAVPKDKYMQHIVHQQLELQDQVKKEESDSDDDGAQLNLSSDDIKPEVKSESDDDTDDNVKSESDSEKEDNSDDEKEEDEESADEDQEDMDDNLSQTSTQAETKRIRLNDAEDGCTVFVTNIPFSIDNDQLRDFAEKIGPVKYALICMDKLTEHSKGTGFIKFVNKEDADKILSASADHLKLEGQVLQVKPALKKENLQNGKKKEPKDNRNLYLVKEGVIVAGTKAAVGVSASDMSKRLALERSKTQMLKNLNRFVSRYRLVVSNLPPNCDDSTLRRVCSRAAGMDEGGGRGAARRGGVLTEARVMRDLRAPVGRDGKHPSKGYGFVMFTRHEDALACLRKLNNNPDIFDKNNRPIVSFSIEDRTALNARKKRLEKSVANNPLAKKQENNGAIDYGKNRKRKANKAPEEGYAKKGRYDKKNKQNNTEYGRFVRNPKVENVNEFTGLTAKEGTQHKMRSNFKLKEQAEVHKKAMKIEKKKGKHALKLKRLARERIKQPKQPINKTNESRRKKNKRRTQ
ncbi:RNA-binding protein 28 [Bombyx mandarina]|uniref:RNA-binding protein 28 n=1 Tax=Bombyx mandarina TaxID=7092 RepID=A0A6J2JC78_BOMMA|nr:RNA-binding protein 28 [Bombyx mandarina]